MTTKILPKFKSRRVKLRGYKRKRIKAKSSPQLFYIYVETLLKNENAFGAYSIFEDTGKEFKTNAKTYWCRTEPRLKLMTLCQALINIPPKSKVVITPVDNYMQYALSNKPLKLHACNGDIMDNLRKECHKLSKIDFKDISQSNQEHRALEALCDCIGTIK